MLSNLLSSEQVKLLGLKKKDLKVLSCLKEPSSVAEITRETNIPRMSVYSIIERLEAREMITSDRRGSRRYWRSTLSENVTGKLSSPGFVVYEGAKSLSGLYRRIVEESKGDRFYFIEPNRSAVAAHGKMNYADLLAVNHAIRDRRIIADGILQDNWLPYNLSAWKKRGKDVRLFLNSFSDRMYNAYTIPAELLDFGSELYIFKNVALLLNWHDEVAIEIRNKEMVLFLKQIFELLKNLSTKVDLNAAVKAELAKLK
ncbi:MAG TPA: helix-turn-helix domain-containing protein [Candidatus Paceibacterota bacterium]